MKNDILKKMGRWTATTLLCLVGGALPLVGASAQTYSLQQLKDSALRHNIAIRNAQHDIDAAQLQRREAFTKYFPNVSAVGAWFNANKGMAKMDMDLSANISPELGAALAQSFPPEALAALANPVSISMMKNGVIAGITATQPVFAGGQIVNGNRLAKIGEDVSMLQMRLSANEVEKNVEQYFWQIVTLDEKMKTIGAVETLLADLRKDVSVAVKAGVALRNDLLQVELRQNELAGQKLKLQNGLSLVRMLLAQYCGLSGSEFAVQRPQMADALADASAPRMMNYELTLLPEYQLLQKQVEAADLQRKMAIGQNLPTVAVGAGYNYHTLMEHGHSFGMLFATVSIPISDWWGGSHAIKRKKIEQQKALDQLADNSALLRIRIQNAWNGVEEARQQLGLARRSIEQADENLRLNRDFYRVGTATMSTLLEAQMLYQQALDRQTDAYAEYQNKLLEYRQAAGAPLREE